jgi:hypothetical protein
LRAYSPNRVAIAATTAPHHPPNRRVVARCMMNEVDPAAPSLERVFSVSSSVDTNKNVAKGHQPGNPKREGQTLAPAKRAQSAMNETKRAKRVSRDICLKEAGIPIPPTLVPCPPFAPTKQRSEEEGHGSNYTAFQHERHPPLISQERWEVVSFAIAHQTLRSTVVRLSPLLCRKDRDPLTLFLSVDGYSIGRSPQDSAHAATPAVPRPSCA